MGWSKNCVPSINRPRTNPGGGVLASFTKVFAGGTAIATLPPGASHCSAHLFVAATDKSR
jgi:hypothetical protein